MRSTARLGVLFVAFGSAAATCTPRRQHEGPGTPAGWQTFADPGRGFSISYPKGWKVDPGYVSEALGAGHEIKGVAFVIPEELTRGTNLSTDDTQLSVERIPGNSCRVQDFADSPESTGTLKADGRVYTTGTSGNAGAGNLYETLIFVLDGTSPCLAVRYTIHSTNLGNYEPGTVKAFDRAGLMRLFDSLRGTLKLDR